MPKERKIPLRMCISCREMKPKAEMLRIVRNAEGGIRLDFSGKLPGRGAYICNREECIVRLRRQRLLNKTFSCDVPLTVYEAIEEEFRGNK